jgi:hypothetical protein
LQFDGVFSKCTTGNLNIFFANTIKSNTFALAMVSSSRIKRQNRIKWESGAKPEQFPLL